jgi:hypothetical protein
MNRRAKFTGVAIVLITAAFYVCMFKDVSIDWFVEYGKFIIFSLLFVVTGITTTDAIAKWRNGGGNGNGGGAK